MWSASDPLYVMTRPPHTHNPAYRSRETLLGLLVLAALCLGVVVLLAAPLATLLVLAGLAVTATGLRTLLVYRRRTGRRRTVCLPVIPVCVTA